MSDTTYNNLLSHANSPFRVLAVRSPTIAIDIDSIENNISIARATHASNATRVTQEQQERRAARANVNRDAKMITSRQCIRLVLQTAEQHLITLLDKEPAMVTDSHKPDGTYSVYTNNCIVRHVGVGVTLDMWYGAMLRSKRK